MPKNKKPTRIVNATRKAKPARKATPHRVKKTVATRKTTKARQAPAKKTSPPKATSKKRTASRQTPIRGISRSTVVGTLIMGVPEQKGLGLEAAGQSGDTQGLSRFADADSESVEQLVEEGQAFEAGVVGGVESTPDADEGEVTTKQVPEDDVPPEYRGRE